MGNLQGNGLARGIKTLWSSGAIGGLSDAELVERFADSRDEAAFEVLVERHGPMVLRVVRDILRDSDSSQDAFQATFLVLAKKAGSIARPEALAAWLYGVAHRVARKARIEADRRRRHERIAAERISDRIESASRSEADSTLHDELARLPELSRVAVVLCYFEGLTYDQAAWQLGVTEATIRGRLARARQQLRTRLDARGATSWLLPALPFPWISPTVRAASRFASGLPGAAPAPVIGLAEGVLRTMMFSPIKAAAVLVAFHLIAVAGVLAQTPASQAPPTPKPAASEPVEAKLALTLDQAIERMVRDDVDLKAKFSEIPQAKADILTAALRANPALYANAQLVPYGQYTRDRPGGQTQDDINISTPLDVSKKRRSRTASAVRATKVTEAQYQDAVRQKIEGLSKAFLVALAARELAGQRTESVKRLARLIDQARDKGAELADLAKVEASRAEAMREQDRSIDDRDRKNRELGRLIGLSDADAARLEVVGDFGHDSEPPPIDALLAQGLAERPDLVAYRLGLQRAKADVKLQYANTFTWTNPDIFDGNYWLSLRAPKSLTIDGIKAPLPLDNRNQGHLERAKLNVTLTELELSSIEKQVIRDVQLAESEVRETVETARKLVKNALLARHFRQEKWADYLQGNRTIENVLEAMQREDSSEKIRVEALAQLRLARVALNNAVGRRVVEE
jgi:cobalt-zinc-cadmium efflux system outer membrane protein